MNHKVSTLTGQSLAKFQVKATVAMLLLTSMLPLLIHLIPPYQGTAVGAILLPMFYVPFIAVVFFRLHVGLLAAALAPVLNFLLTGNPQWQIVAMLSFELVAFTLIAYWLLKTKGAGWIAAPLSYLITKVVSSGALLLVPLISDTQPLDFFLTSIHNGIPGILMLCVINVIVLWYQQHR